MDSFREKTFKTYSYYLGLIKFENHDTFQLVTGRDVMSLLICLLYAVILIKYSICLYINNGQLAIKQSLLQYKGEIL